VTESKEVNTKGSARTSVPRAPARYAAPTRSTPPVKPLIAVLIACAAVVLLFAAGIAAEQFGRGEPAAVAAASQAPTAAPAAKKARPAAGVGDAVRDGQFEFLVSRVDCSRTSLGIEQVKRSAAGRYCQVTLTAHNVGDETRYFVGRAQKAKDAAGTAYDSDEIAGVYANHDTSTFLEKLDPGEKVTGTLVFDVPKNVELTTLELHDSPLSGGVRVTLRQK
jgi:hypothetical protein